MDTHANAWDEFETYSSTGWRVEGWLVGLREAASWRGGVGEPPVFPPLVMDPKRRGASDSLGVGEVLLLAEVLLLGEGLAGDGHGFAGAEIELVGHEIGLEHRANAFGLVDEIG